MLHSDWHGQDPDLNLLFTVLSACRTVWDWVIGTNYYKGPLRDYHRDPFPHSRLRTRQRRPGQWQVALGFWARAPRRDALELTNLSS